LLPIPRICYRLDFSIIDSPYHPLVIGGLSLSCEVKTLCFGKHGIGSFVSLLFFFLTFFSLYKQLLNNLRFYQGFEINNFTGEALTENNMSELHYSKLKRLQQVAFKQFQPELRRFALSSVGKELCDGALQIYFFFLGSVDTREKLKGHLQVLKDPKLAALCENIHLIDKRVCTRATWHVGLTKF
jgi:hypothetical protein